MSKEIVFEESKQEECNICLESSNKLIKCHLGCNFLSCSKCYLKALTIRDFTVIFKCPQCRRRDIQILWSVPKTPLNIILESDSYIDKTLSNNVIQYYLGLEWVL